MSKIYVRSTGLVMIWEPVLLKVKIGALRSLILDGCLGVFGQGFDAGDDIFRGP